MSVVHAEKPVSAKSDFSHGRIEARNMMMPEANATIAGGVNSGVELGLEPGGDWFGQATGYLLY